LPRRRTHLVAGREPHSSLGQPLRDVWHRGRRPAHVVERRIAWAEQLGILPPLDRPRFHLDEHRCDRRPPSGRGLRVDEAVDGPTEIIRVCALRKRCDLLGARPEIPTVETERDLAARHEHELDQIANVPAAEAGDPLAAAAVFVHDQRIEP
jgi:hypothetical protein